jgi:5,10-methylenetetrahydrofolate reductase
MDAWIDLNHAVRRFTADGRWVFLTDDAVGQAEEESLGHLAANLDEGTERRRLVPFLTCKHTLEYCLLYAERAAALGLGALTVVGGDTSVGPPRCVPHAEELRRRIRERVPELALGGWANPFRDPEEQAGFLAGSGFTADFVLTQVVSHHDRERLENLLAAARRRDADRPTLAGIFHYRSANPRTLERLGAFFPVPATAITREFDSGSTAEEITARSIQAALDAGADAVYVSNLGLRGAPRRLQRILGRLVSPERAR